MWRHCIEAVQHEKGERIRLKKWKEYQWATGQLPGAQTCTAHASPKGRRKWGTEKIFEVETIKKNVQI